MNYILEPNITKEFILSKISEEQIMEYYLHIRVSKKLQRSPLRFDKYPTINFFRSKSGILYYRDFATGQTLNCFNIVELLFNCSYYKALKIIANDFGLVKINGIKKNKGEINTDYVKIEEQKFCNIGVEIKDFTERELNWWKKIGITLDTLKRFDVFSLKHVFIDNVIVAESSPSCPIYGYYGGKKDGHELWRIYFPKRDLYRFMGNYPKGKIQCWNKLPKSGKLVCITKSQKDAMVLSSLGIPSCAPNSETSFLTPAQLENLKSRFKCIIVFYDNDRPGIHNMWKIRKEHPELNYIFIPKRFGSKDISDFYSDHGKEKTINLICKYCLWLKEKGKLTTPSDSSIETEK